MPSRFLIFQHSHGSEADWLPLLRMRAKCEIRLWATFSPAVMPDAGTQLILAHAVPEVGKAMAFFDWLHENPIRIPVFAVLPEKPGDTVLQAVSRVVDDFLLCPLRNEELTTRVTRLLSASWDIQAEELQKGLGDELRLAQLVGKHPQFRKAVDQAKLFAASDPAVLITGETGTGKELFAHAIHSLGRSRQGPFIPVDCCALPEHLAENELFGHRRGAFTDAHADQQGLAGMAEGGTLFLDEIDSLSLANQAKLLRFLQERSYRALGSDRFTHANVRVIAATNRCLEDAVRRKEFRSDLYFRLSVLRLHLPSLRERYGDIPLLANYFVENECAGKRKALSPAALRVLEGYSWPGNVRELFNAIQRAVVCSPGRQILPEHIALAGESFEHVETIRTDCHLSAAKRQLIEQFERRYVHALLAKHQGNVTRAARDAGKERRAFGRLVKKYRIAIPEAPGHSPPSSSD